MNPIESYFTSEKNESLLFVLVGLLAIAIATYFLFYQKQSFYKGMSLSLLFVALIQIVVGTTVFIRSPNDLIRVEQIVHSTPEKIESEEIPRMNVVMKNFILYRYIEIALLSMSVLFMFAIMEYNFMRGLAVGLFLQSTLMLALDFFAEKRGSEYLAYLKEIL